MDLNKLTTSDKVIVGSGILLFIAYFLDWFTADTIIGSAGISGGDVGFLWSTLPMLIGLLMLGCVVASKLFGVKLPELPIPWSQAYLGAGALAAVLVVLKLLLGEEIAGFDLDRSIGIFLAALAAIGLAVGGFLKLSGREDDTPTTGDTGTAPF